ncbi:hypothetical protein [Peribacillus frigoritolerans]|uniref:hypothetical protein n=1 Tax=Peribacillus frigoritolerans TaxID=450367 RepID=UPI00399FA84C
MAYQQKDYYISAKDNEYYHVLSIAKNLLVKANNEGRYPVWGETLEKLIKELEENRGDNVTPWQYNFIISILLEHVPEDLKRDLD